MPCSVQKKKREREKKIYVIQTQNVRRLYIYQRNRFICSSLWHFSCNNFVPSKWLSLGLLILKKWLLKWVNKVLVEHSNAYSFIKETKFQPAYSLTLASFPAWAANGRTWSWPGALECSWQCQAVASHWTHWAHFPLLWNKSSPITVLTEWSK